MKLESTSQNKRAFFIYIFFTGRGCSDETFCPTLARRAARDQDQHNRLPRQGRQVHAPIHPAKGFVKRVWR